jgi:transcription-repair coupling factor (superfamily II helicase)
MPDEELDRVMTDFIAGKFDVLLATTIVESGLDIPNANTMFIDESDRYGLADLHQLRGRVGRYKHKAYCYLLLHPHKHINPNAAKRLQAIETFSEMGAGFALAMRDLEIRGAGNLLGTEQSGHIATVGYELYCQMLETAVRRLKQLPQKFAVHVDIDLPGVAYLPDDYIADRRQKIDFYRRMTRVEAFAEIEQLRTELIDRFGPPPAPVERLLKLADIKLEAAVWQIHSIFLQDNYVGFRFADKRRIQQLAAGLNGKLRIIDDETAIATLKSTAIDSDRLLATIKAVLHRQ